MLRQVAQYADAANLAPSASMGPMSALTREDKCAAQTLSARTTLPQRVIDELSSVLVVADSGAPRIIIAERRECIEEKLNALPERVRAQFRAMGIIDKADEVTLGVPGSGLRPGSHVFCGQGTRGMISRPSNSWGLA